jgi:hypothetical protein
VFLVNLPVVALAMLAGWPLVPESRDPNATPLDPVGAGLSIVALVALVFGIIQAPEHGWTDPLILGAFGLAAVLAVAFLWWERRIQHPMLPMELFRNPRFSVASGAITMVFFALFGSVFLLTQHLQFVLGYTPLQAGVRILPLAALIVAAPLAARLAEGAGTKLVVVAGLVIVAGALWLLSTVQLGDGYGLVAWALALLGAGMGFTMVPATESIMGSLPLAKSGVGSAMNDTTRQVGGALGVAVLGSILASSYGVAIQPALGGAPPPLSPRPPARGSGPPPPSPRAWGRRVRACWTPRGRPSSRAWATPFRSAPGRPRSLPCWCCCSSLPGARRRRRLERASSRSRR